MACPIGNERGDTTPGEGKLQVLQAMPYSMRSDILAARRAERRQTVPRVGHCA